ncbi:hypothetical protein, partial [Thioalkalivibrio sp. HK1]|uniref:hypothetical protein n=1 Tax=Thioalkalivibrio sp. HK1 TaxID=1469245 RepID=UPI001E3ED552
RSKRLDSLSKATSIGAVFASIEPRVGHTTLGFFIVLDTDESIGEKSEDRVSVGACIALKCAAP